MATYIGIKGVQIQTIAGDPANPIVGQVWYNTTANTLKSYGLQGTGAWASTGSLNTARNMAGGSGDTTAGLVFGGGPNSPTLKDETETYDGSTWTAVNPLNTGRNSGSGCGTQTASLFIGGNIHPVAQALVEEWNGTSWTVVGNLNGVKSRNGASGTVGSAISWGGIPPPMSSTAESWDGTSWTNIASLGAAKYAPARSSCGTGSSCFGAGGYTTSPAGTTVDTVEKWSDPVYSIKTVTVT